MSDSLVVSDPKLESLGVDHDTELHELTTTQEVLESLQESMLEVSEPELELLEVGESTELIDSATTLELIEVAMQGPPGPPGIGSGSAVFVLGATGLGGIVGGQSYEAGAGTALLAAISDTSNVRITVGASGGSTTYVPAVTVNGITATMVESSTKRWFTGAVDIVLVPGDNIITVTSSEGGSSVAVITRAGAGPDVTGVTWSAYPGAQTELKAGDAMTATITTAPDAVSVTVAATGCSSGSVTVPVNNGVAVVPIVIGGASGAQPITVTAKNALGTDGTDFVSPFLTLNQTHPTVSAVGITYPANQTAFNTDQTGAISVSVSNADTTIYASPDFLIAYPSLMPSRTGYVGSGTNITVTATRLANAAVTVRTGLAKLATVAPTASISIGGNPSRLISSPSGQDYTVTITPSQTLASAPTLTASHGAWQGSWVASGNNWVRTLRITDATVRGTATFSALGMVGLSGIAGNAITSGAGYVIGGMTSRTLTFPAFSRVAALGAAVGNVTRTSAAVVGGNTLSRYSDNTVQPNGYYIADAAGNYSATGEYLGLSDTAFAGANTSGSLQVTFAEAA